MAASGQRYAILVIGKSGNGRSAVCNTLLGADRFTVGRGISVVTREAQEEQAVDDGDSFTVIDTPDITNCGLDPGEKQKEVDKWKRMLKSSSCVPMVLVAVRCDVRYTAEEYQVYKETKKLLKDEEGKKKVVVAFTFGDELDGDLSDILKRPPPELKTLLKDKAHNRYLTFANQRGADRPSQAKRCFDMARKLCSVKKGHRAK